MPKSPKSKLLKTDKKIKKNKSAQSSVVHRPGLPNQWTMAPKGGLVPWARRQFPTLRHEFQHLADRVWNFAEDELFSGDMKPAVDVSEDEQALEIVMDLPGFDPAEIDIQIENNTITIRSQRETCVTNDEKRIFHRSERPCGAFSRTLALPFDVGGKESASFDNGVLTITIPKSKSSTGRKIKIRK